MNKILNKEVSFDLAKRLKDEPAFKRCNYLYHLDKDGNEITDEFIINRFKGNVPNNDFNAAKSVFSFSFINTPTIAEVIDWIYEKHGIWIYSYKVEPFVYEDIPYPKYVWISKCDEKFVDTDNGLAVNHYNSLIEAYEAAIEYTLNNLT